MMATTDPAVSNARIYSCVFPPLADTLARPLRPHPQRTLSNCPNEGDALRERAPSTGALPDLGSATHFLFVVPANIPHLTVASPW
jgi:hypothetical protein